MKAQVKDLTEKLKEQKMAYEKEFAEMSKEHEEKVSLLLHQLRGVDYKSE